MSLAPTMKGTSMATLMWDMNDVALLDQFLGGQKEPTQEEFWRADIHPFVLNGRALCPRWDGVLTWDDWEALFSIAIRGYDFAWEDECPYYDFDHDGYIDHRSGGDDCDDFRDFVNPAHIEECGQPTCWDNFDNDCDGLRDTEDPDCREWCPAAAQASTIGAANSSRSKSTNILAILLVPVAAVVVWRSLRGKR